MHEKGIDDYSDEEVSVIIVWLPMFPGDSEAGAIEAYDIMSMHRVFQFWDPERLSGLAYSRATYASYICQIAESLPDDHRMKKRMMDRRDWAAERSPLWDYAAFYPPGVEWGETPPVPAGMVKQLFYSGPKEAGFPSTLFVDDFSTPPVQSDWYDTVEQQMKRLMKPEDEE